MKKIDDLIEKNGKFFEKNSIQPFTGKVEGQIKGYLKDGMPEVLGRSSHKKVKLFQKVITLEGNSMGSFLITLITEK